MTVLPEVIGIAIAALGMAGYAIKLSIGVLQERFTDMRGDRDYWRVRAERSESEATETLRTLVRATDSIATAVEEVQREQRRGRDYDR